jgi:hypothetical protein
MRISSNILLNVYLCLEFWIPWGLAVRIPVFLFDNKFAYFGYVVTPANKKQVSFSHVSCYLLVQEAQNLRP